MGFVCVASDYVCVASDYFFREYVEINVYIYSVIINCINCCSLFQIAGNNYFFNEMMIRIFLFFLSSIESEPKIFYKNAIAFSLFVSKQIKVDVGNNNNEGHWSK